MQVIHHLDLGGSEEVAISLAEQLQGEYDLSFFAVRGIRDTAVGQAMKRRLDQIGVRVHSGTTLELKRGGFLVAAARLAALTRRLRPEIVHLHTEVPELTHAFSQGFLGSAAGRPAVLTRTLHNTVYWGPWQWLGSQVEKRLSAVPARACSNAALEGMQSFRTSNGLTPLAPAVSGVIYNGVAPATTRTARAAGPLRVMFAGRLEPQKGVDLLPAILAHAASVGHPPAELNIYGAGSLKPDLERLAAQGVPGWTINMFAPTPRLRELMMQHDLLLMPSRFEGLGLVAAEALIAGLPVIGTQIAGMGEVFPEQYPLLAPPENSLGLGKLLAESLQDIERILTLSQGWIAPTTEKFSVSRMGREYGEMYRQLLQSSAVGAASHVAESQATESA